MKQFNCIKQLILHSGLLSSDLFHILIITNCMSHNELLSNAKTADNTDGPCIYGCLDRCHIPIGRWGSAEGQLMQA